MNNHQNPDIDMPRRALDTFKRALWQGSALIVAAGLIGVAVNLWRADGIDIVGNGSVAARFATAGDSPVISLNEAGALFAKDAVLFLDARPHDEYARGHIRGALSLPWPDAEQHFIEVAQALGDQKLIVTYCDGKTCNLSHELAQFLMEMGFDNVRVLVNGWSLWRQAGLPTAGRP